MAFSLWCDFLEKDFIENDFADMIKSGKINGATTNPAIFNQAFEKDSYKQRINSYLQKKTPAKIYELLSANDVKAAAFKLLTNYANGEDGFISIEIEPTHFDDGVLSLKEGKSLFNLIKMPNVMIKIPASEQGIYAITELVKKGINVNATLVFSVEQAKACLAAFEKGLKAYRKRFANAKEPECVISVFVSRFDRELAEQIASAGLEPLKYGIYNAVRVYNEVESFGLPNVRTVFASTGVKDGGAPADYYVKELAFEHSINTAPLSALNAINAPVSTINPPSKEVIDDFFARAKKAKINYNAVCKKLFNEGIIAFKEAYAQSLELINSRLAEQNGVVCGCTKPENSCQAENSNKLENSDKSEKSNNFKNSKNLENSGKKSKKSKKPENSNKE